MLLESLLNDAFCSTLQNESSLCVSATGCQGTLMWCSAYRTGFEIRPGLKSVLDTYPHFHGKVTLFFSHLIDHRSNENENNIYLIGLL
jgi:hypothetical protein